MRKVATLVVCFLVVCGSVVGGVFMKRNRDQKRCRELWQVSSVKLTSEERTELRSLEPNPEEVRDLLVRIHKERMDYWETRLESARRRSMDIKVESWKTLNPRLLDLALNEDRDRREALEQIAGFRAAIAVIKEYRFGMPITDLLQLRIKAASNNAAPLAEEVEASAKEYEFARKSR